MAKNRRAKRRYEPSVTPTHFIRISRIKARIEPGLKWYVLRTAARRERDLEEGLLAAGIKVCRAAEIGLERRARRVHESEKRPAAGYVFAGFPQDTDGRHVLWSYHGTEMARQPPMAFQTKNGELTIQPRSPDERPFTRVMGPFDGAGLQRFINSLAGRPLSEAREARLATRPASKSRAPTSWVLNASPSLFPTSTVERRG